MPDATPKSSQSDTLDQWRKQQKKDLAERQKREAKAAKKNRSAKRGAALPTWLAEFFLLAMLGGLGFASIFLGESAAAVYRKADRFLLGLFAPRKR